MLQKAIVILAFAIAVLNAAPHSNSAETYLSTYGYLPKRGSSNLGTSGSSSPNSLPVREAVKNFQKFANLPVTGTVDRRTLEKMALPRCSVPDDKTNGNFVLQGSKWNKKDLTYKITKYPSNMDHSTVDKIIKKSFKVWSWYTDLKFTPTTGSPDIEVKFVNGEHGDGNAFDGSGGTLAHAYYPAYGGDAHFDDAENWAVQGEGTNLFMVATHEIGHSLGLSHSQVNSAMMTPFYTGYNRQYRPDYDDIEAVQLLYGKKSQDFQNLPERFPLQMGF